MSTAAIGSILAATDLSAHSDAVVGAAAGLAASSGARLHVLHAFDLSDPPYGPDAPVPATFGGRIADAERALVDQVLRATPDGGESVTRHVVIRTPSKAVLEAAWSVAADLIVIGTHRAQPFADSLLGSTADRVVREAEVPCLLMRGRLSLPLRKIVIADDLSRYSRRALEIGLSWGVAFGVDSRADLPEIEVDVVHVIPGVYQMEEFPFDSAAIGPEFGRGLAEAVTRTEGAGQLNVREEVLWGDDPAERIVGFAGREHADLIVLGTHGRGAVRRALLGSVASAVARTADCPVLLIPPKVWRESPDAAEAAERVEVQERS